MNLKYLKNLGPGLLYAGAAVGVSHLVQSTRAGADFALWMIAIVLLTNIVKYPFFEFASRYTAVKKESVLSAYKSIGNWALILFLVITFSTMFVIQTAIVSVTAGIAKDIFGLSLNSKIISLIILLLVFFILIIGKLKLLNSLMKFIIITLAITSLIAAVLSIEKNFERTNHFEFILDLSTPAHLFFLVALIGWMPAPLDITVWQSVWTKEKIKSDEAFDFKASMFDFKVGYWGTAFLAVLFVIMGSMTLYNTGIELPSGGAAFSNQLLAIFTNNIGSWAYVLIAIAAFTTMMSTNLSVMDAYPRVIKESFELINFKKLKFSYTSWLIILFLGTSIILLFYMENMKQMVDLATTMSFLTAPILAYLNIKIVSGNFDNDAKPEKWKFYLSYFGIALMTIFSLVFLYIRFF